MVGTEYEFSDGFLSGIMCVERCGLDLELNVGEVPHVQIGDCYESCRAEVPGII